MVYLQLLLISLWLVLTCVVGLVACFLRWGDLNLDRDFARVFAWGALKIVRIRVVVHGKEHLLAHQPCIYVGNHQSGLDMATFGSIYPSRTIVIGKKELHYIPFFGLFFLAAGNVMIDRQKRSHAFAGLSKAVEAIKTRSVSIWIFPEGTRKGPGDELLPFKKGAFHMALEAGVPIVPIVCAPLEPLVDWQARKIKPGVIHIQVLPPIKLSSDGEVVPKEVLVERLLQETRSKMLEALRGLSTHLP